MFKCIKFPKDIYLMNTRFLNASYFDLYNILEDMFETVTRILTQRFEDRNRSSSYDLIRNL